MEGTAQQTFSATEPPLGGNSDWNGSQVAAELLDGKRAQCLPSAELASAQSRIPDLLSPKANKTEIYRPATWEWLLVNTTIPSRKNSSALKSFA